VRTACDHAVNATEYDALHSLIGVARRAIAKQCALYRRRLRANARRHLPNSLSRISTKISSIWI